MPFRQGRITTIPGKGTINPDKKTFQGKGKAPAGYHKIPEATIDNSPVVTIDQGRVTTSGFRSKKAARAARKAAERRQLKTLHLLSSKPQKRSQGATKPSKPKAPPPPKLAPPPKLSAKPKTFAGAPTAGEPTLLELKTAKARGRLGQNAKGYVTTPAVRKAAKGLKKAKAAVRRTEPSLAGLSPAEREVAHLARKAHRKYPDVPASVLMSDVRQESGFKADAVSSAGAGGLSQFIPSTAAQYGVKYGTGKREKQSQITGQAHYLHDLGFAKDPQAALSSYSGGYAASDYNNPVLAGAADYRALDKPGSPKAVKRLAKAQAAAQEVGLKQAGGPKSVPKKILTRYKAAQQAAKELEKAKLPYVWGGGHGSPTSSPTGGGLDCSGAVSYVLNKMGALKGSLTSGDMGQVLDPGPGLVTVFYNPEHTFMRIGKRYFGTSASNPAGGAGFISGTPDDLSKYNVGHVPGLGKKVAVALGVPLAGEGSFPGMSLSSGGTTAVIDSGATVGKPGFSNKPIRLSASQRFNQTERKLQSLSLAPAKQSAEPKGASSLAELERKYGSPAV